jgi:hypothetical protein
MSVLRPTVHDVPEHIISHEVVREPVHERTSVPVAISPAKLSWGSILGGLLVALGLWVLLGILGLAAGLSAQGPALFQQGGFRAGLWTILAPLVSLLVGGLVAARSAGIVDRATGAIHGAVLWALALLASLTVLGWSSGAVPANDPARALDLDAQTGTLRLFDPSGRSMWWVFFAAALGLVAAVLGSTAGVSRRQRLAATRPMPLVPSEA